MRKVIMQQLLILTLLMYGEAYGISYYVDTASSLGGNGTTQATTGPDRAWASLSEVKNLAPGDKVLLRRGCIWREQLTVPNSGAIRNAIVIGAYGSGDPPIISGADLVPDSSWSPAAVDFAPAPCYQAPWYGSTRSGTAGYAFCYVGGAMVDFAVQSRNDLTLGKWYIDDPCDMAYYAASSSPCDVEIGNTARNYCISVNTKSYITIQDIQLESSVNQCLNIVNSVGILAENLIITKSGYGGVCIGQGALNTTVENCDISYCNHAGIYINGSGNPADQITIRNNFIHDVDLEGIAIEASAGTVFVQGNIIDGVGDDGHERTISPIAEGIWVEGGAVARNVYILNNTVYNCEKNCLLIQCTDASNSYVQVRGNIFYALEGTDTYAAAYATSITGRADINYNCYYKSSGNTLYFNGSYSGTTFGNFQAATGWDANSIFADPQFVNVADGDFRLQQSSPCLVAGQSTLLQGSSSIGAWQALSHGMKSDLDSNGIVNFADFAIFASEWLCSGCGY